MNYLLRDVPEEWWHKLRVQTVKDETTIREVILKSLAEYVHRKSAKREGKQG